VDQYCTECVALKRRLLRYTPSKPVRVELRLHVNEREPDTWNEPVNYDRNSVLSNRRLGR
jgi:predicted DsbA family dithiol-disulfide isomerase